MPQMRRTVGHVILLTAPLLMREEKNEMITAMLWSRRPNLRGRH